TKMLIKKLIVFLFVISKSVSEDYNDVKESYEICNWNNGEYSCIVSKMWDKFVYDKDNAFYNNLPIEVCYDNSCEDCVKTWKTLAVDSDYNLHKIGAINHTPNDNDGSHTYYDC